MKFPSSLLLFPLMASTLMALAAPETKYSELTPLERHILSELEKGEAVVLSPKNDGKEKPKLSSRFIEQLVTGTSFGTKLHRNGIRIFGAKIDGPLELANAQVPYNLWLVNCEFSDAVDLSRVTFSGITMFSDSVFKAKAEFVGASIKGPSLFMRTVFEGEANFGDATFDELVAFDGARFMNQTQTASFVNLKAARMDLEKARFEGPVEFGNLEIANDLVINATHFNNHSAVRFARLKVGGGAFFRHTRFSGPVSFEDGIMLDLFLTDSPVDQPPVPEVNLSRVLIRRQLVIQNVRLRELQALSLRVEGPATFSRLVVEHEANLSFSSFATVDFSDSIWPKKPGVFYLQGITFRHARAAASEVASHAALLKLLSEATYTADIYANLEQFFLRQGYRADADEVFLAGKRRERSENLHEYRWLGSWLLDWLVGYGRRPWQAGIPCALFIVLGCFLFRSSKMEPQKPEFVQRVYNPFWYSLDLFLPFVNLQADDFWKPKQSAPVIRHYSRVHILFGWILIPILLAAVSGLIK